MADLGVARGARWPLSWQTHPAGSNSCARTSRFSWPTRRGSNSREGGGPEDHRDPSHISKTVLSIVKIGPLRGLEPLEGQLRGS